MSFNVIVSLGVPKTATMVDNETRFRMADHQLKVREIAETVGILQASVAHNLHEILGMKKLLVRWQWDSPKHRSIRD